jgi:hypothetical protein
LYNTTEDLSLKLASDIYLVVSFFTLLLPILAEQDPKTQSREDELPFVAG